MRVPLALLFALPAFSAVCPSGYSYYKNLTVQSSQVTGTQSNFRALILNPASSSGKLATVANGGRVTSASGYDIVPATTTGTLLPFQMVGYVAASGNLQMWVDISSIADGSQVHLCYGNSGVTTYQGDDATTWSGYTLVSHAEDNAATTVVVDATGNWPGTSAANTSTLSAAGKIGNALTFNGTSSSIDFGNVTQFNGAAALTVSMWAKSTTAADFVGIWSKYDYVSFNGSFLLTYQNSGQFTNSDFLTGTRSGVNNTQDASTTAHPFTNNTWHLVTWVFDGSQGTADNRLKIYVDGAAVTLGDFHGSFPTTITSTTAHLFTGGDGSAATLTGQIDDTEIAAAAWSAGLVASLYKNQNAPGNDGSAGFWSVGSETPIGGATFTISPILLPASNAADIVVSLTGSGTSWDGTTVITASGVSGTSCGAVSVGSTTAATVVCTTGATTGTLTLTESVTGGAVATVPVGGGSGGTHAFVGSGG